MKRDLSKAIADYEALTRKKGGNFGAFYASDFEQLRNIAIDKGGISFWNILFYAIDAGLQAGFMIGYRAGRAEVRR